MELISILESNNLKSRFVLADNGVLYITFDLFSNVGLTHGFSTRVGGVSTGIYKSMNLSFNRGDDEACVVENHKRFAAAVGYDYEKTVMSDQIHKTDIAHVTECDAGFYTRKGITGMDGLITDVPGVPLMTFYADCVPLFFYDPVKKVVAAAHSGWRGTVAGIGRVMVDKLVSDNGCNREDILAVVGPSICGDCYEVSSDVVDGFSEAYGRDMADSISRPHGDGKFLVDLWEANRYVLESAGIKKEHIQISGICTYHNPELMISHRETEGKRGNMAGVVVLCGDNA